MTIRFCYKFYWYQVECFEDAQAIIIISCKIKTTVDEFDSDFKVVMVGTAGVGKSAILLRFADDKFDGESLKPTIGIDLRFKTLDLEGRKNRIQIWDTAGQEVFRNFVSAYYKGADAIIVVYDSSNEHTFVEVESFWS